MDDNYWGLFAVVKGCSSATTSTAKKTTLDSLLSSVDGHSRLDFQTKKLNDYLSELNESGRITSQHEVVIPACPEMQPTFSQAEPMSVFSVKSLDIFSRAPQQLQQEQVLVAASTVGTVGQSQLPRPRKRQSLSNMVYEVPKGSRDEWSWRKYGQKPIKGSPYPRSYYKCNSSTSIGCLARKKVELKTGDPTMQVVTYVGNHNHQFPEKRRRFYTNIWGQNIASDLTLAQAPLAISQTPKKNENDIRLREIPDDIFLGWEDFPFLTEDEFPGGAMHP